MLAGCGHAACASHTRTSLVCWAWYSLKTPQTYLRLLKSCITGTRFGAVLYLGTMGRLFMSAILRLLHMRRLPVILDNPA